jgi:hypothetical protein
VNFELIASPGSNRDAGVYIELEASALSREIPGAVGFVADPIVRAGAFDPVDEKCCGTTYQRAYVVSPKSKASHQIASSIRIQSL